MKEQTLTIVPPREWTRVCHIDDVPERGGRAMKLGDVTVAIFRTSHGSIMVMENRCPHKGGVLSEGIVTGNKVICPLHGWKIDMITGEAVRPDKACVHTFPVDVRSGEIFVDIGEKPPLGGILPLADITGIQQTVSARSLERKELNPMISVCTILAERFLCWLLNLPAPTQKIPFNWKSFMREV